MTGHRKLFQDTTIYDILSISLIKKRKDAEKWRKSRLWIICGWRKHCSILAECNSEISRSANQQLAPQYSLTPRFSSVTQPHCGLQANLCNKKSISLNHYVARVLIPLPLSQAFPSEGYCWQLPFH